MFPNVVDPLRAGAADVVTAPAPILALPGEGMPVPPVARQGPEPPAMVAATQDGRQEIKDGRPEIKDGRPEIKDGRPEIKDGRPEIKDGRPGAVAPTPRVEDPLASGSTANISPSTPNVNFKTVYDRAAAKLGRTGHITMKALRESAAEAGVTDKAEFDALVAKARDAGLIDLGADFVTGEHADSVYRESKPGAENDGDSYRFGSVTWRDDAPATQAGSVRLKTGETISLTTRRVEPAATENRATPTSEGKNISRVRTAAGTEVETRYKVVPADSLITSHKTNYEPDGRYLQDVQPRDRSRTSDVQQVEKIISALDPTLLGDSRLASDGAPIVGSDGIVESGNGRTIALKAIYERGQSTSVNAHKYVKYLQDHAEEFGYSKGEMASIIKNTKHPVLVRERVSDIDRVKFAREANESNVSAMSSSETALSDAKRLTPEILYAFNPEREIRSNSGFLREFLNTIPQNERGNFIDNRGQISQDGLRRVQNALFAKAYGDSSALSRMSESMDDSTKTISSALLAAAPRVAALENNIEKGLTAQELSIRKDIAEAANKLNEVRETGQKLDEYLSQIVMDPALETRPEVAEIMRFMDANKRSGKKIAAFLNAYADSAMSQAAPNQGALFDVESVNKMDLIRGAEERAENPSQQGKLEFLRDSGKSTAAKAQSVTPEENIRRGNEAMDKVIAEHTDVRDAMYRDDVGGISFLWGESGDASRKYDNGSGISHILAKRASDGMDSEQFLYDLVDVLATGKVGDMYTTRGGRQRRNITKGSITATLGMVRHNNGTREEITWVVTGWDENVKKPSRGNTAEAHGSSVSTLSETTPSVTERERDKVSTQTITPGNPNVNSADDQYLTSTARRDFEPDMPARGPRENVPRVTVEDVKAAVRRIVPLREGRTGRGALGLYKAGTEVARTKYRNDIPAAMHELGHYLDSALHLRDQTTPDMEQELADAGRVASADDYTPEQLRNEGIAQFMTRYSINDEQAQKEFPEFYRAFTEALAKSPSLTQRVNEVRRLASSYYKQNPRERLDAAIVRGDEPRRGGMIERARRFGQQAYDMGVDSLAPLRRLSDSIREELGPENLVNGQYLPDSLNIYARSRTSAGYRGRADQDVAPFLDVLRGLGRDGRGEENHRMLTDYLAAARSQDYRNNGMNPGLSTSAEEEARIIDSAPQYIKDAADRIREIYADMVHKTLVQTGIMTQEQFDFLRKKWPNYVPFFRVGSDSEFENDLHAFLRGRGRSLVNLGDPIRAARGVKDEAEVMRIRDPIEAMLRNMMAYHALAARNEVGQTMINVSQLDGMGRLAEPVSGPGERGEYVFHVWQGGQKRYFATDPDIYSALTAMGEAGPTGGMKFVADALALPADIFRQGTTQKNPAFLVMNFLRDSVSASINSEGWALPIYNTIRGLMIRFSANPEMRALFDEAVDEGLLYSGITEIRGNSPRVLAREIGRAFDDGGMTRGVVNGIRNIWEYLIENPNRFIETAPKLYEYYLLRQKGMPKQEAAMRAREVNIDFQRAGSVGRTINRSVAFMNANIQGVDKMIRTAVARPVQTMSKLVMYSVIPSLIAWGLGMFGGGDEDRDEYQALSKGVKDRYWHVKMGDQWVKIPKPQDYGVFGSLTERVLDRAFARDPAAFRGFDHTLWELGLPPLLPNLAATLTEGYFNYDTYAGHNIVPRKYENLPESMQHGPGTSGTAKLIGEWTGISPFKIDHVIRGTTGGVGQMVSSYVGSGIDVLRGTESGREARRWSEAPVIQRFTADPYKNNEYVDQFYELSDWITKTVNGAKKGGEYEKRDAANAKRFSDAQRNISGLNRERAAIQARNDTPENKRRRMDNIDRQVASIARRAVEAYWKGDN
ncbi:hypothetical protein FACS1894187_06270 [Synergistales bacterium]|nr:hypothetical protein FACS1894187_06270 [Synergistales bacterium]